jgi:hypothetical protein
MSNDPKFAVHHRNRLNRKQDTTSLIPLSTIVLLAELTEEQDLQVQELTQDQFARYADMLGSGESHNMAFMLSCRQFPNVKTDATFLKGLQTGDQFGDCAGLGLGYKQITEEKGYNTAGKVYLSQLARYPGDPEAWVSGRGDVERVCRDRGYTCEGAVNYKPLVEREATPALDIDPDIVEDRVQRVMESPEGPDLNREEVRESLHAILSGKVDPNPPTVDDYVPHVDDIND